MDDVKLELETQIYRIRLWPEELGDGQIEWRGQVRHLSSGETRYFREWPALVAFLEASLPGAASER